MLLFRLDKLLVTQNIKFSSLFIIHSLPQRIIFQNKLSIYYKLYLLKTIKSIRLYIPHFRKSHKKKKRIFNHNSIFIPFYRILHAKINPSIRRREEHRTNAIISQSKWIKKKKGRIVPYESRIPFSRVYTSAYVIEHRSIP